MISWKNRFLQVVGLAGACIFLGVALGQETDAEARAAFRQRELNEALIALARGLVVVVLTGVAVWAVPPRVVTDEPMRTRDRLLSIFILLACALVIWTVYEGKANNIIVLGLMYLLYLVAVPYVIALLTLLGAVMKKGVAHARWQAFAVALGFAVPVWVLYEMGALTESEESRSRRHAAAAFTAEQRARPLGSDAEVLEAIRGFRWHGGRDAPLLRNALERRTLTALLGEAPANHRTMGEAIDAEQSPRETIMALQSRATGAVTVERLSETSSGPPFRMLARNGTRGEIDSFGMRVSDVTGNRDDDVSLVCRREGAASMAPMASYPVLCEARHVDGSAAVGYALPDGPALSQPRPAIFIVLAGNGAWISAGHMSYGTLERGAGS